MCLVIVPDNIVRRYCHNLFPKEDRINDFMNLNFDIEVESKIIKKSYWYPLDKIELY